MNPIRRKAIFYEGTHFLATLISSFLFQDLYRKFLVAEADGNLEDVNMLEVEKFLLDPRTGKK